MSVYRLNGAPKAYISARRRLDGLMKRHVSRPSASIALPSELKIDGWPAGTIKLPFRRLDSIFL
jgi:hypothetical protein